MDTPIDQLAAAIEAEAIATIQDRYAEGETSESGLTLSNGLSIQHSPFHCNRFLLFHDKGDHFKMIGDFEDVETLMHAIRAFCARQIKSPFDHLPSQVLRDLADLAAAARDTGVDCPSNPAHDALGRIESWISQNTAR